MVRATFALACLCLLGAAPARATTCDGPAPAAALGTAAYLQRELDNDNCGEQRVSDTGSNPAFLAAAQALVPAFAGGTPLEDPFRDPGTLDGRRFRTRTVAFTDGKGERLPGRLFEPCDRSCGPLPPGVLRGSPPYPGVIVVHGGSAEQEMYLWGSEALAEDGYMVLTFQIPEPANAQSTDHVPDTRDAIDFLMSTPSHPTPHGDVNPLAADLDRAHIGLAGHSAGGVAVSLIGQQDRRISAIVSWDRAQSSPMPAGLKLRTPALFLTADFNCQRVPVCVPQPYLTPPDPEGPGNKDQDFQRLAAAHVDTMKVALRAATHLDFTQFVPGTGSRYGAVTASYYTLAWFDRYLRGARDPGVADAALRRLTAARFDDSADVHNISGGTYDAATGRNVPAHIAGQPVRDRLSFHFRSAWSFEQGACEDIRAGCAPLSDACPRRVLVELPRAPRGDRIVRASVSVGGRHYRPARIRRGHRVLVDLGDRTRAGARVAVSARTRRGRLLVAVRRFRACSP